MIMETNLRGRLRNTSLPFSNGLLPMFEAVINSIHAIEEANISSSIGQITVEIIRDKQKPLALEQASQKRGPEASEDILGFRIIDNGIGFTDSNMKSFLTLDSEYKANIGGRGVGRLLWLKAFNSVAINSVFLDGNGKPHIKSFTFTANYGVSSEKTIEAPVGSSKETRVQLDCFKNK